MMRHLHRRLKPALAHSKNLGILSDITLSFDNAGMPMLKTPTFPSMHYPTPLNLHLYKNENEYCLEAEVPSLTKDDIKVRCANGILTIEALKAFSAPVSRGWSELGYSQYSSQRERSLKLVKESVELPSDADVEFIKAKMNEGILTVTMPRLDAPPSDEVEVIDESDEIENKKKVEQKE